MKINVNSTVKVKLSKEAYEFKKNEIDKFNKKYGLDLELKLDNDGYYYEQLWVLMKDFGHMFCCGSIPPFIEIKEIKKD